MRRQKLLINGLIGTTALVFAGAKITPERQVDGPVLTAAVSLVGGDVSHADTVVADDSAASAPLGAGARSAVAAFSSITPRLSHPLALEKAVKSYFAFKAAHPEQVKKPLLYFVDYGLPSTAPRGFVLDMEALRVVDGPFTVAHGRGSSKARFGVPTRFSNTSGSATSSLGLFLAQETYAFSGKAGGRFYRSIGLRLKGLSGQFNDRARDRGVVAHGAPYVTATGAGRSEGCPAVEESRAQRLLPKLANGALVFLFAPDEQWMSSDPWVTAARQLVS